MFTRTFKIHPLASVLLTAGLGLGAIGAAQAATTHYVRTDGGDASQCNGRSDAAYPGSGTAQNCAWKHPYYALPTSGTPRIAAGDTLMIHSGEYMIGYGAPGATCTSGDQTSCWLGRPPSGTSSTARTRILGYGPTQPKLWGAKGNAIVVNLKERSNLEIGNLEITDKDKCVVRHGDSAAACVTGGNWATYGVSAWNTHNVWIHDLNVHGLGHTGMQVTYLSNWTVERTRINANGWAGWNGPDGTSQPNQGKMTLRDIEVAWNGCGQDPATGAAVNCWAQAKGGYGDGIGLNATAGEWLVEDAFVHHNTSDGLDFLYLDGAATTSVVFRRVYSAHNAGNQIKSRGNTIIENSVLNGRCGSTWKGILSSSEMCRASGNSISVTPGANATVIIRHNTITGEGDNLILTREGVSTGKAIIQNNVLVGQVDYMAAQSGWPSELTNGHYNYNGSPVVTFSGNLFWNVKGGQCPSGSVCGQDPKLTNMTLASFDANPLAGSPAIDKAPALNAVTKDFYDAPRPSGAAPDIGAIEVQSGGTAPAPTPTPTPSPTCTRAAPAVTVAGPTGSVAAGTKLSYTVNLTNKDSSACANTSFSLARTVPSGWTGTLSATSVTLAPGASTTATLDVTSAGTAAAGNYGIGVGTGSSVGSAHTANASATYSVKTVDAVPAPSLSYNLTTNKTSYKRGEWAYLNVRVYVNGKVASGVPVKFTTKRPDGSSLIETAYSGSDGYAQRVVKIGTTSSAVGTYNVTSVATYNGTSVTKTTSFKAY